MNPYRGPPRPEHDAAWHELLQYSNIRVGKDTLDRLNRSSIKLADGSGDYFGGLSVHHHLHCLKYVRHYLHRDYYNATDELKESNLEEHIGKIASLTQIKHFKRLILLFSRSLSR